VSPQSRRWRQGLVLLALSALLCACGGSPAIPPTAPAAARDPQIPWPLTVPPGFRVMLYARGLEEVRSVAFSPDGTPYVTIMNRKQKRGGKVLALPDANHDGRADRAVVVKDKLDRPHGIVFYKGELYISDPGTIYRLHDTNGDLVSDAADAIVTKIPYQDDHWARPFVFDDAGHIFVAIGSTCDACQEGDKRRATIMQYTLDDADPAAHPNTVFARGLRSAVGLAWRPGTRELWATNNGPDHLGPELPPDQLFHVEQGKHYGWPYCYGDRVPDPDVLNDKDISTPDRTPKDAFCRDKVAAPALLLPPHSAPLGMAFYDGDKFPAEMRGSLFIALHGSFAFANTDGYRVIRVPFVDGKPGAPQDFLTGWTPPGATTWLGRPVNVAVAPDGSMYVTDDVNGFLYRIDYVG
jgi:glucose/arabinose dehydrogenase